MGSLEKGRELFDVLKVADGFNEIAQGVVAVLGLDLAEESDNCIELVKKIRETLANVFANNFSDEEISRIVEFHKSPEMVRVDELCMSSNREIDKLFEEFQAELRLAAIKKLAQGAAEEELTNGGENST